MRNILSRLFGTSKVPPHNKSLNTTDITLPPISHEGQRIMTIETLARAFPQARRVT